MYEGCGTLRSVLGEPDGRYRASASAQPARRVQESGGDAARFGPAQASSTTTMVMMFRSAES